MTQDAAARTRPGARWTGPVVRTSFRLAMAALILLLAVRTYEETAVAHARSNGSLHTSTATLTKMTSHMTRGTEGGGQDGGSGHWFVHVEYTIDLRVGDEVKTLDRVPERSALGLEEGQRVVAGLWHGRVVEIDGRLVWPGWHTWGWDMVLYVLYPLIMGYAIALALAAATYLAGLRGRVRPQGYGPWALGYATGAAAALALMLCAFAGNLPPYGPVVPLGAGILVALAAAGRKTRRVRSS